MLVKSAEVEMALQPLIGQPLSDMWRFGGWQRFEFGPQKPFINRKGEEATHSDYFLDVGCDWRIIGSVGILVGSGDYGPGSERRDEQAHTFFESLEAMPPVVQTLAADVLGGIRISMTAGYVLEIVTVEAIREDQWLFLLPDKGSYFLGEKGFISVNIAPHEIATGKHPADSSKGIRNPEQLFPQPS